MSRSHFFALAFAAVLSMTIGGPAVYVILASVVVAQVFLKPKKKLEPMPEPPTPEAPKSVEEGIIDASRRT